MKTPNEIADAYISTWNERDQTKRNTLIARDWSEGAIYIDPLMQGTGHSEIASLIDAVQERFPDFRFSLLSKPDGLERTCASHGASARRMQSRRSKARIS